MRQSWGTGGTDDDGKATPYVGIDAPTLLGLASLGLSPADTLTVVAVLLHRRPWDGAEWPYPSKARLAKMLGEDRKTVERRIKKLARLKLCRVRRGPGRSRRLDFQPLLDRLAEVGSVPRRVVA